MLQSGGYVLFNLNAKYKTVTFTVGHVDSASDEVGSFKIFIDEKFVQQIDMKSNNMPKTYTIPLNGAMQLRIEKLKNHPNYINGDWYGFADIVVK